MSDYYAIIINKKKGFKGFSPLSKVIEEYHKKFDNDDYYISFPGYLSIDQTNLDYFALNFPRSNNRIANGNVKLYFKKGMNGLGNNSGALSSTRQYYINGLYSSGSFQNNNENTDHSKVLIVIDKTVVVKNISEIDFATIANINDPFKAILVGSSNQNTRTYFHGMVSPNKAGHGETDVFLIKKQLFYSEEEAKEFINSIEDKIGSDNGKYYSIILTKPILGKTLKELGLEILY